MKSQSFFDKVIRSSCCQCEYISMLMLAFSWRLQCFDVVGWVIWKAPSL